MFIQLKTLFGKKTEAKDPDMDFLLQFRNYNEKSIGDALQDERVNAYLLRAVGEYNSCRYGEAIWTLEYTVHKCVNDSDKALVACLIALFCYDEARYEKARLYIDAATGLRPQFKSALVLMKRIYDIINECRGHEDANPDLIKLRNTGTINISDLDILKHNVDIDSVRKNLDAFDKRQFDRKLESYRKYHNRKKAITLKAYNQRLDGIMHDLEECTQREFLSGDPEQVENGRLRQAIMMENVQSLCSAQTRLIKDCVDVASPDAVSDDVEQKLLLFSTWHFYLAGYAKYQADGKSGEFYHIIHRAIFPYTQEIQRILSSRFPDLDIVREIGTSTKEFGTKAAELIKDSIQDENTGYEDMASEMTNLFIEECGIEPSAPVGRKLYRKLYGFATSLEFPRVDVIPSAG